MISAEEFKEYNRRAAEIGDGAASAVEQRVLGWCRSHKEATVAEKREAAKLIMEGFVQAYDEKAAVFASQWYDYRAEQGGARLKQAVTMTVYEPGSVDDVARYQARKLAKEGDAAFARACGEFARNDAFRSLNETIIANVGRDRDKGARFARVPAGTETCTFCLMLASRGAVYHSRKTAGEFKHFHRNCDCKVVPSFEGDPDAELVQGVKPRELYGKWWLFEKIDATEGLSSAERDEMKRLVLEGGELPEKVRETNPTAHMRKAGRASSGWISAGVRLDAEVKVHGFSDVTDFYEYLGSRRTRAEIDEATALGDTILGNADVTPKFYELAKAYLHKSAKLVDGAKPRELHGRYGQLKEIDATEGLRAAEKDELKRKILDGGKASGRVVARMLKSGEVEEASAVHVPTSSEVPNWLSGTNRNRHAKRHAAEYGIDYRSRDAQEEYNDIMSEVIDAADSVVLVDDIGGQNGQMCAVYFRDTDIAVVNIEENFRVTLFKYEKGRSNRYDALWDKVRERSDR